MRQFPPSESQVAEIVGVRSIATFPGRTVDRAIKRVVIDGPRPSRFDLYIGVLDNPACLADTTPNGWQNTNEYSSPLLVRNGFNIWGVWDSIAGQATILLTFEAA